MGCFISTSKKPSPPPSKTQQPTSKSPPPSSIEEETVKEVLAEFETTPTLIPKPEKTHSPFIKTAPLLHDKKHQQNSVKAFSDDSSVSTNVTEKTEDFHEVRQKSPAKMRNRSYSGEMKRERTVGKSPGRVRSGCGYVKRGKNGESSGRRSSSPVTRSDPTRLDKPGLDGTIRRGKRVSRRVGSDPGWETGPGSWRGRKSGHRRIIMS